MNLENVAAVIRPRTEWESVDLGYCMVRFWARPIYTAWATVSFPLFLIPWMLLYKHTGWAMLVFWWTRVLAEPLVLDFLSKALFGAAPRAGTVARKWPRLALTHGPRLLLLRPIALARTFLQPIAQLEGLRGAARRERVRVVAARGREHAWLVTFCSFGFECIFLFGLLLTAQAFIPEELRPIVEDTFGSWSTPEGSLVVHTSIGLLIWAAWSMVAPFHVGAGFSSYLNRRALLEGWDIEIAFRRMAQRLTADRSRLGVGGKRDAIRKSQKAPGAGLAIALLTCLQFAVSLPTEAQKTVPPKDRAGGQTTAVSSELEAVPGDDLAATASASEADTEDASDEPWAGDGDDPHDQIVKILEREEFGHEDNKTEFQFRPFWGARNRTSRDRESPGGLGALPLGFLAPVLEVLLWAVAIGVIIGVLLLALRAWGDREPGRGSLGETGIPDEVFGLDIRRESLPDDPAAAALALLARGEARRALSLLYRATLARLVEADGLPIEDSWTEGDCLRWLEGATSNERFDFFAELTTLWSQSAYAHRDPDSERLKVLCQGWPSLYLRPDAASDPVPRRASGVAR